MPSEEMTTPEPWLMELLGAYTAEIRERSLIVHSELDSRFQMRREPLLETALERLFRFAFSTLPNDCEIYLASSPTLAPVTALDSGTLILRWQVAGETRASPGGEVVALRPIVGGAAFHARSRAARELAQSFSDAGWTFDLEATNGDRELWLRASTG